jgi:hypothetical protein
LPACSKSGACALLTVSLVISGCVSREAQITDGQQRYLVAKQACITAYPSSLVRQSDCRTQAANEFIRPWYRYPDLMTELQQKRRELAIKADAHEISHAEFDRLVARAERASDREEERRNLAARTASTSGGEPAER